MEQATDNQLLSEENMSSILYSIGNYSVRLAKEERGDDEWRWLVYWRDHRLHDGYAPTLRQVREDATEYVQQHDG